MADLEQPKSQSSEPQDSSTTEQQSSPGALSMIQSVLAAMFGVQSDEKRAKDFETGNLGSFVFVGVIMVVIFVLTLITIVNSILESGA